MSLSWIESTLEDLRARRLLRTMRRIESPPGPWVMTGNRRLLNLASNNYLDLATHPRIRAAVREATEKWGWGGGASQLVSGYTGAHDELVRALAAFEHAEDAVLFPTGYQANLGVLVSLAGAGDTLLLDKLCHASLIDGARLSGATLRVFPHRDLKKAERLLQRTKPGGGRTLLATDSVFSMDGDVAPLPELADLCEQYDAPLVVDEAHATGVLGTTGRGAVEALDTKEGAALASRMAVRVGTLSKALGGLGGFAVGSRSVCDLLRNRARSAIFTTSLPPVACVAAREALALVAEEPWRREAVLARAALLRHLLREASIPMIDGSTPIVAVLAGEAEAALRLSQMLLEADILAPAIRPPTVAPGTSRVRLSLMATHTEADVRHVAETVICGMR